MEQLLFDFGNFFIGESFQLRIDTPFYIILFYSVFVSVPGHK